MNRHYGIIFRSYNCNRYGEIVKNIIQQSILIKVFPVTAKIL